MNKKQVLDFLQNKAEAPLTISKIARALGLPRSATPQLGRLVKQLVKEGELVCVRGNRFGVAQRMDLVSGFVQVHRDGFGFLIPEKEGESDVFIKARYLREVMDGDKVLVQIEKNPQGRKREGRVIRIIERKHTQVVGRYEKKGKMGFVVPIDPKVKQDTIVYPGKGVKVRPNQIVVAQLVSYPTRQRSPEGKIVEVLGNIDTPGIETDAIIRSYELPLKFPPKALAEAQAFPEEVEIDHKRTDLRDWVTFTIDGEKARDYDDAVSIQKREDGGWRLGVHIADVSHYVRPGSALDKEAVQRGCSVYFPDRVVPMLPERLSNGLCSLNPGVDRLTFSAIMDYNPAGKLVDYQLLDSVIKSRARLTYTAVKKMLADKDPELCARYAELLPVLQEMNVLAEILKKNRIARGGLDFDLPEPEIILDLQGQTQDIIKQERNLAHEMIENFMLAANCTVATHMSRCKLPFIYRIHEKPDAMKLAELNEFVKNFGYSLDLKGDIRPGILQKMLGQIKDKPEEMVITINTLRSLKLACYSTRNEGHFGLAMTHYSHFTSPIRRYPDLVVHRLLRKARRQRKLTPEKAVSREEKLSVLAQQCSFKERTAEKAERDIISIKRTQFMAEKLGEEFTCIVCGISPLGLLIELEELFIEGLIHVSNMQDDYYHYREQEQVLAGERTKKRYKIGDKLLVQVERADVDRRQTDFRILKQLDNIVHK